MTSSIYPLSVSANIGIVSAIAVVSGGTGYIEGETVTITGATSGAIDATGTVTVIAGVIQSVTIVNGGTNYTDAESVTMVGVTSGASNATGTATAAPANIPASSNIFLSDIEIIRDHVSPGGGGILRLLFAFAFNSTPASISVFNNSILKGTLNADNSNNLISNGYYRFDIDVEEGDNINLQATEIIDKANFLRAHLVQFGA